MKIFVDIASTPERDEVVAEAFIDDLQWCELSQDGGKLLMTFFCRPDGAPVELDFDLALSILKYPRDLLVNPDGRDERPEWHTLGNEGTRLGDIEGWF